MNRSIDGWMDERMGGSIRYPYSAQGVSRVLTSRRKLQFCKSCCDRMLKVIEQSTSTNNYINLAKPKGEASIH